MRISEQEKTIVLNTAKKIFGENCKVYLFGSRVYDNKRGGDIDIYIETDKNVSSEDKIKFLTKLELAGIQRKVDLLVKTPFSAHKNIYNTAKNEGILLEK